MRQERGRRKQALGLTGKHGEINGPGEDAAVSSGKGLGSFLNEMALSLPGLGLRNYGFLGHNRPILLL